MSKDEKGRKTEGVQRDLGHFLNRGPERYEGWIPFSPGRLSRGCFNSQARMPRWGPGTRSHRGEEVQSPLHVSALPCQ